MTQPLDYESLQRRSPETPWLQKPHPVLLAFLAMTLAYVPTLAIGVGTTPCFLFLGALFTAIVTDLMAWRTERPLRVQALGLFAVLLISTITSYWTAHPSANRMFDLAFGIPPPAGVKNIVGRAQWFDGLILVMRFDADATALGKLLQHRGFVTESLRTVPGMTGIDLTQVRTQFSASRVVDAQWNQTITGMSGELWRWDGYDSEPFGTILFVNEKGEVWVVYVS